MLIPRLFKLLEHKRSTIRKETCWIISNIAAGTVEQIELVFGDPLHIQKLVDIVLKDVEKVYILIFSEIKKIFLG